VIAHNIDEDGVMQVIFSEDVSYKDIIDWLAEFSEIPDLPSRINLIYDLRDANIKLEMVKLIQVAKRTEEATKRFERVRTVFLIEEAKLPSYSALFSFLNTSGKTTRKLFSDSEKALDWLLEESRVTSAS
jgi:hypothetical protein